MKSLFRFCWIAVGVGLSIFIALGLSVHLVSPVFLASIGGSAVFLFGLTRAPAAQPRAFFGGHFGGAAVGIACFQFFGDALWVYALAQVVTVVLLLLARCVHPPAGANPLIMIHAHASWSTLVNPLVGMLAALAAVAYVWSRVYPGLVHYPVRVMDPSPPTCLWGGWGD